MNPDSYIKINQILLEALDFQPIAFVDIETTGVSPANNRMIEIGIVRINPDSTVQTYTSLVNPDQPLSFFIRNMTGIRQSEVDQAPSFESIRQPIQSLLENAVFIAHNVRFDYSFIQSEFSRCDHLFKSKTLCTVQLSRKLYPQMKKHSLAYLIETFDINVSRRHRALDDAQVMHEWLRLSHQKLGTDTIQATIRLLMKDRFQESSLSDARLEHLPTTCGAYILRDTENRAVYIGRGLNIRKSVWSHLHKKSTQSKERKIAELSAEVDYFKTSGELSAFFKARELVQAEDPVLNKKLTRHQRSVACIEFLNKQGYKSIRLKPMLKSNPIKESIVGTFKSKKIATRAVNQLSQEWKLCEKWLGINLNQEPCSGAQLLTCKGACTNQEDPDSYNTRFNQAFAPLRIQKWPYKTPALIGEQSLEAHSGTAFLVDQWTVQAMIYFEGDSQNVSLQNDEFEWDVYLILKKYLNGKKSNISVKPLSEIEAAVLLSES